MITLINYDNRYQPDFKKINLGWLDKYGLTESHDLEIMNDPQSTVLDQGGCIFLAMDKDKVVGTAGLWKNSEKEYELIKMSVEAAYHGRGIGKLLLEKCIGEAKDRHAERIILFSNSQLTTALRLYGQYGFKQVEVTNAPFLTADVKMELVVE